MLQSAWPSPPLTNGDACTSSISGRATCSVDCGLWELLPATHASTAFWAALPKKSYLFVRGAVDDLSLCTLPARACDATGRAILCVVGLGARTNARRGQGKCSSLEVRPRDLISDRSVGR